MDNAGRTGEGDSLRGEDDDGLREDDEDDDKDDEDNEDDEDDEDDDEDDEDDRLRGDERL